MYNVQRKILRLYKKGLTTTTVRTHVARSAFVEDNEMRSLERRIFFARASITGCVHGNGKKDEGRNLSCRSHPPAE